MLKLGWFGGLGGTQDQQLHNHPIECMTSYSTFNRNYASILYLFIVTNFNRPHLNLGPLLGVTPCKVCQHLWR